MTNLISVTPEVIQNQIYTIRGKQVMMDRDLAALYGTGTKRLNEQMKRNIDKFPERYCFQLNKKEQDELVAKCDRFKSLKHSSSLMHAYTEPGVAMLSSVLKSATAVKISIQIIDAFIDMRKFLRDNADVFVRLDNIERKQFKTDENIEKLFTALESKDLKPKQGIFYDGQVFDAYTFVADVVREAKQSIVLIDNYIDDTVLRLFVKRQQGVSLTIYTQKISSQLALDLQKHNAQYDSVVIKQFSQAHDRFLILDDVVVYHIGASLKDLGKKWFAFSKIELNAVEMLGKLI